MGNANDLDQDLNLVHCVHFFDKCLRSAFIRVFSAINLRPGFFFSIYLHSSKNS